MHYVRIENNIITGEFCGAIPQEMEIGIVYKSIDKDCYSIGEDIRFYSDFQAGIKKPLETLIKEQLIKIPTGKKLNSTGTDFIDMTEADKVAGGILALKPDEKIDGDYIVKKTKKELYEESLITAAEYNAYMDTVRESAYRQESDPLGMQVLRGDIEKKVWLDKIEEIKRRFPKVQTK